jgi:gliding motility-associated-like protein
MIQCDTQYITILVNHVDVEILRPKREPDVPLGTSVNIELRGKGGKGGYTYQWSSSPDDDVLLNRNDTLSGKNKTRLLFTNQDVLVVVMDTATGCFTDTLLSIIMTDEVNPDLPNAFSPNGDGINDVFMKGADLLVFNRWGMEIFKSSNKEGWDGKYKGKYVEKGTYLYVVTVENEEGEKFTHKGVVTVF